MAGLVFYAIISVLLIALAVLAWILKLFEWRVNSAVHHFHGDLEFLESGMDSVASKSPIAPLRALLERLDSIERRVV